MPQTVIYLSPEVEKKIGELKEKLKMSKSDVLQKIIIDWFEENKVVVDNIKEAKG